MKTKFRILRQWVDFDGSPPFRRDIDVHRLGPGGDRIHTVLRETLAEEIRDWLDINTPGYQVCWYELVFRDPNEAFAFRMRWGGSRGIPLGYPYYNETEITV